MAKKRDDFNKSTIDVLAKRVGFLCSSPTCRKSTIGANEQESKSTSIGIAAHITAAAPGGPRYDSSITPEVRSSINNGIWLCSNCATLIDKDESKYTVEILKKWKEDSENESTQKLNGGGVYIAAGGPHVEADLILTGRQRGPNGYSPQNPKEIIDGKQFVIIYMGNNPINYWKLGWDFNFVLCNNSNYTAYNVTIESIGNEHFSYLEKLPKINNIAPLQHIDLRARCESRIESDYIEANRVLRTNASELLNGLNLKITYFDDNRDIHVTHVEFSSGLLVNRKA